MSRLYTVLRMSVAHQVRINELLRRYRYGLIDTVRNTLADEGIEIARTSLWRYARRLRSEDYLAPTGANSTLIVVLELRTGRACQVKTEADATTVIGAIRALDPAAIEPSEVPISHPGAAA